ncbi:hypothetical protein MVEN_00340100 [Mycena venus]|uniref:Uncharacterized protein n=1 Tax=Mycena venus TaxID=2733690 RepID=A0A8H6YR47_9AGAR|nr:hypothetical protein MVEN_00340100 [Mycena venus]
MRRQTLDRKPKALGTAKSAFAVNPDFGYLHTQVPDKDAFRYYMNAPAGRETQDELQEFSQDSTAGYAALEGSIMETKLEIQPITVKAEKENLPLTPTVLRAVSRVQSSTKRARVDELEDHAVKLEPDIVEPLPSDKLRISVLEAEVASLRSQILVNQQTTERIIQELQRDWQAMRQDCIDSQVRVRGLRVRMDRVEGHVDEIVVHLPACHGWKSEVGSDFDPDITLAEVEVEDGSQPEWTQSQTWSNESEGEKESCSRV